MKELNMYIPIRDETIFMVKYYQYLFNKYWSKDVNVYFLGYKKPDTILEDNIHFISLAEKRDPDPSAWSTKIVEFFESIDDEYFYWSLEDFLIIRPVDHELLEACKDIMYNIGKAPPKTVTSAGFISPEIILPSGSGSSNIGRIDLWNSAQFDSNRAGWVKFYKEHKGVRFLKESQVSPPFVYRVSCSNSIWNREWFLKTLQKNWTSTQWELFSNDGRHNNDGYEVLSTIDRWTPSVVHALSSKYPNTINVSGMVEEDIEKLKELTKEAGEEITFKRNSFLTDKDNPNKDSKRKSGSGGSVINLDGWQPDEYQKDNPNISFQHPGKDWHLGF